MLSIADESVLIYRSLPAIIGRARDLIRYIAAKEAGMSSEAEASLGQKIRKLREGRGWSLSDLARETEISRSYLYELEAGRRSNPTRNVLQRLSDALGSDLSDLVDGDVSEGKGIPESLKQFAEKEGLGPAEVRMLAGLEYRGRKPQNEQQWRLLYQVIKATLQE